MFRTLWFLLKLAVAVAAAVWIANRPGTVSIHWLDYTLESRAWFALFAAAAALCVLLALHRVFLALVRLPRTWARHRRHVNERKGQRALLLGITAVAAGDSRIASYQAFRARRFLPRDRGLTLLLEGDAARLKGDRESARTAYTKLLGNKDAAFLGMRGLLSSALEQDRMDEALRLSRQALALNPRQPWILRLTYGLELKERRWDDARKLLKKLEKAKVFPEDVLARDRQALLLRQAEDCFENGQGRVGLDKLKQAYRIDPSFVPAATRLAARFMETGQRRAAVKLAGRSWAANPHPELAALWARLAPSNRPADVSVRLRWFEKLVASRPDSAEGYIAAAGAAVNDRLWGEARQFLQSAESIRPSPRVYALRADMEEQLGHSAEARHWREKAADAPADPVWTCRDTGLVYESWSPVAEPHGAFNTIVWGYPDVSSRRTRVQAADPLFSLPSPLCA